MMLDNAVVSANYATLILRLCEARGITMSQLITGTDIDPQVFTLSHATLSGTQFVRFVQNGYVLYEDPAFGIHIGQHITVSTHGMVGFTLMTSSTLREAFEVILRYYRSIFSLMTFELQERNGQAVFSFAIPYNVGSIEAPMIDGFMVGFGSVINFIVEGLAFSAKIRLQLHEQTYHKTINDLFDAKVEYGCDVNEICFDSKLLGLRLLAADPQTTQVARAHCEQLLRLVEIRETFPQQVREKLFANKNRLPKLDEIARLFHMHPRTLGRHLNKDDTSYQELLDEVRETLALEYLANPNMLIEDIAYALNFNDTSSFYRAFKRWTGVTPSEQRKKLMEQHGHLHKSQRQ